MIIVFCSEIYSWACSSKFTTLYDVGKEAFYGRGEFKLTAVVTKEI